jgi:hypothetical protein
MRAHPRAIRTAGIANVKAICNASNFEVYAAHARITEDEIVGRVAAHRCQRAGHGNGAAGARA